METIQACLTLAFSPEPLHHKLHWLKQASLDEIMAGQCGFTPKASTKLVNASLQWRAQATNHHIIHWLDPRYPTLLKEIPDPPLALFVWGDPASLNHPQLAIVGSRRPTVNGLELAREYATGLSHAGWAITSGLALGIDGAAHQGALNANGYTLAVLGTGINTIYPTRHQNLAAQISQQGAVISEFAPGTPALPHHFPMRNRIISGLSQGVLVVEAAIKSGSLITARLAAEQGREVFALPGTVRNRQAQGCLQLIQQGALCVTEVSDITQELSFSCSQLPAPISHPTTPEINPVCYDKLDSMEKRLLEYVNFDPCSVESLVQQTDWKVREIITTLSILELKGFVDQVAEGYLRRK